MRFESAEGGIEGVVAKKITSRYRLGRTGDWVKVRQKSWSTPWSLVSPVLSPAADHRAGK